MEEQLVELLAELQVILTDIDMRLQTLEEKGAAS